MFKSQRNKRRLSSFKQNFKSNFKNSFSKKPARAKSAVNNGIDKQLLIVMSCLTVFGIVMVYSASFISHSKFWYFTLNQAVWVVIGSICGIIAYHFDYKLLPKLILPGLIVTIILLIAVLIPGIGTEINGSRRWLDIGPVSIQPSELIKLVFIIYLASWSSKVKQHQLTSNTDKKLTEYIKHDLLPFGLIMSLICGLVLLEPDLDTAGIIGFSAFCVYFMGSKDKYQLTGAAMIIGIIFLFGIAAALMAPYRLERISTYLQFITTGRVENVLDEGYQQQNIMIAVSSGGIFGVGFGESRQKFHYLGQTAFSDNIFAVIAEEFGLIGASMIATVYLYLFLKGIKIANSIDDEFGKLLASGIIIWITSQAFIHIGSNIGLLPVTGVSLPFISYGGSSLITVLVASGILLNISKQLKK